MQKENLQSAGGERNAELLTQVWTGDLKAICQPSREGWVWVWVIGLGQWNYSNYPWEDFAVRFWQTTAVVWGRQSNGLSGILLSPIRIRVCTPRNPPVDSWQQPGTSSQHPEPRTQNPVPMSRGPWAPFVVAAGNRLDIPSIISAYHSPTSIDIWLMAKMSPKCRPRRRRANKQLFRKGRGLLLISKNGKRNGNHNFATLTHHNFQSAYNSALPGKQSIISYLSFQDLMFIRRRQVYI